MEKKILNFIQDNHLVIKQPLICATSGGVDSVCLITILNKLGYKVVLAHVNHHKREQSQIEEEAMSKLAEKLNIPFEVLEYYYKSEDNFHNDAHHARYTFFKSLCHKYQTDTIVTAHHLDDQLETILMKLLEGSNLYGYGGISICNTDGVYRIIRPLLCANKQQLYEYAKENHIVYFEDSSNAEDEFLRNRIRHHVIPLLKNENVDIYKKSMQYSVQMKEAFQYIRSQSIDYLKQTNNMIKLDSFNKLDIAVQKDIISLLLETYDIRKNYNLISDITNLLNFQNGNKQIQLENGFLFVRSYDKAYIKKEIKQKKEEIQVDIKKPTLYLGKYKFYFSKKMPRNNAKYIKLCYNNLELPFKVRPRKDGDCIELLIGTKKVSRVFIDYKVPKTNRETIPLIVDNQGSVLWIYDLVKSKSVYNQKDKGDIYFVCEEVTYA